MSHGLSKMCLCHSSFFRSRPEGESTDSSLRMLLRGMLNDEEVMSGRAVQCPVSGCIAPWLALGKHLHYLRAQGQQAMATLITIISDLPIACPREAIDATVEDFMLGIDHIIAVVEIKTSYADVLPFAICGCAYNVIPEARAHGLKLVEEFDKHPNPEHHDRVTLAWLSPTLRGSLRVPFVRWCRAECELPAVPRLKRNLGIKLMTPCCEQPGEAAHAKTKTKINYKPSRGKQASLRQRMTEIRPLVTKPDTRQQLVANIEKMRDHASMCKMLGIFLHPVIEKAYVDARRSRKPIHVLRKTITLVIYRFDAKSQFEKHQALKTDNEKSNRNSDCLLYTSPSPRDQRGSRMPSSA